MHTLGFDGKEMNFAYMQGVYRRQDLNDMHLILSNNLKFYIK